MDHRSARWLADKGRGLGLELELERFEFNRVVPQDCYLEVEERRIEGLPFFDGGFTSHEGISGRIGPIGSDAEIGMGEVMRGAGPLGAQANQEFQKYRKLSRSRGQQALVAVTVGEKPGLMATNAPDFRQPFGPPCFRSAAISRNGWRDAPVATPRPGWWHRPNAPVRSHSTSPGWSRATAKTCPRSW